MLQWSSQWTIEVGPPIVLTAGPDVRFELEGLDVRCARALTLWHEGGQVDAVVDGPVAELRTLLVGLGALTTSMPQAVMLFGDPCPPAIQAALAERLDVVAADEANAVGLVLRTGSDWPAGRDHAHLAADLTHHHTLVLGPLVIPGVTSCIGCLTRQTERRWGPDTVASTPAILAFPAIVAELIAIQVDRAAAGDSPLVNATMMWNLATGHSERADLLRAPDCGGPCRPAAGSELTLPWLT